MTDDDGSLRAVLGGRTAAVDATLPVIAFVAAFTLAAGSVLWGGERR